MIDPAIIRENYAQMTDEQLMHLAKSEGQDLTSDALSALHDEFLSRNLDTSVFGSVEDNKNIRQQRNLQKVKESAANEFTQAVWTYALDEKAAGATDNAIRKGLASYGLDEEHATLITDALENTAKNRLASHKANMVRGGITCGAGFLITYWTMTAAQGGGTYVVAWGAIVFGAYRFLKSMHAKEKFDRILENIEAERGGETSAN